MKLSSSCSYIYDYIFLSYSEGKITIINMLYVYIFLNFKKGIALLPDIIIC